MPELRAGAIIFDMDGVIIDSGDIYARHWRDWGACRGYDYDRDIAHVHPGRPPAETIRIVAPELDADAEAIAFNARLDVDDGEDALAALPGAVALLGSLPAERWTIATSAYRGVAVLWLGQCGVPVPPALVTVDDVENGKPAPDPYLLAAERLGVDPARCLVIEDAPAGVQAARSAGARVLALRTTHSSAALSEADYEASDLASVTAQLHGRDLLIRWSDDRPLP